MAGTHQATSLVLSGLLWGALTARCVQAVPHPLVGCSPKYNLWENWSSKGESCHPTQFLAFSKSSASHEGLQSMRLESVAQLCWWHRVGGRCPASEGKH